MGLVGPVGEEARNTDREREGGVNGNRSKEEGQTDAGASGWFPGQHPSKGTRWPVDWGRTRLEIAELPSIFVVGR